MLCLAILRGINPLVDKNDIHSTRLVHTRNKSNMANSSETASSSFPSIIVLLLSTDLINQTMLLKKNKNYFTTRDIDQAVLSEAFISRIPFAKIILNSVLSSVEYKNFLFFEGSSYTTWF